MTILYAYNIIAYMRDKKAMQRLSRLRQKIYHAREKRGAYIQRLLHPKPMVIGSGSQGSLLSPSPIRTVLVSFPTHGSSLSKAAFQQPADTTSNISTLRGLYNIHLQPSCVTAGECTCDNLHSFAFPPMKVLQTLL